MEIAGTTAPRFKGVGDAFAANFDAGLEVGAALAVFLDGELVVDLWAGSADPTTGRAWTADTLQCVFSSTKAITGLAIAMLVDRGVLDYDAPIASYWPEFAQQGKEAITLRDVLCHRAGLPVIDEPLTRDDLADFDRLADALARQAPVWEPRSKHGYGAFTVGFYPAEVLRRVDGRTLGRFVAEEIAAPLGAEFWIGLPEALEPRVARIVPFDFSELDPTIPTFAAYADPESLINRAMANPPIFDFDYLDSRACHAVEIPAANGITTARSFARIYAACSLGGTLDGVRLLGPETLAEAARVQVSGVDEVYGEPTAWALGFFKPSEGNEFSPNADAFGHAGIGGSIGFADPTSRIGFGYAMNRLGTHNLLDPRPRALVKAVYTALG
jgi:CubicO group peptidase (beta-lactamase class C family)